MEVPHILQVVPPSEEADGTILLSDVFGVHGLESRHVQRSLGNFMPLQLFLCCRYDLYRQTLQKNGQAVIAVEVSHTHSAQPPGIAA